MTLVKVPDSVPDFYRHVYCIMGLPFDAHTLASARQSLVESITLRKRCVIVTPNVNFIAACQNDAAFRDLLLKSDMSLVDGMPIFLVARLLSLPIPERVSGAGMFESLAERQTENPISVYLFGEAPGIAKSASEEIQINATGITSAGWLEPAFSSVETLSENPIIDEINGSHADFLVIALGAQKGQRWIDLNVNRLNTPAICHLGAVIKMTAGVIRRAPLVVQKLGFEWLWRIKEEPFLWSRYRRDAYVLLKLLLTRTVPYITFRVVRSFAKAQGLPAESRASRRAGLQSIRLSGHWREVDSEVLRSAFTRMAQSGEDIELDLSELTYLDSAIVGLLLLLRGHCLRSGARMHIRGIAAPARRILHYLCAEFLLDPVIGARQTSATEVSKPFSLSGNDAEFAE